MSTDWCRGFDAAPWECRYFPLSPVFVGLKCAQASQVSVYLSAFTFLSVFSFSLIFYLEFVLFLRQGRGICWYIELYILFFLSFLHVYHVHSCVFSSSFFFSFFSFLFLNFIFSLFFFFFSFLLLPFFLLHLLRVHFCWRFMCTFASFVDFPFFFWRVSCEGGFSSFLTLIFALGTKMYFCVLWSVWIYSL